MLIWLYWISLSTVIVSSIIVAYHAFFNSKFIRIFWLGGIGMFGLAGLNFTPQTWLVGFMVCLACACVGVIIHMVRYRYFSEHSSTYPLEHSNHGSSN